MRVAAVQLNATADQVVNLAVADRLTKAAASDGAPSCPSTGAGAEVVVELAERCACEERCSRLLPVANAWRAVIKLT